MIKHFKSLLLLLFLCISTGIIAQEEQDSAAQFIDYFVEPVKYEIGNVSVTGTRNRDENAIRSIAGLKKGQKITLPSDDIARGIKKLYNLRLFENVEIIQEKIVGDVVFLNINLVERPILSRYSYKGVKKSKHDDLNEIVQGIINKGNIITINNKELTATKIKNFYIEKGYLDTEVAVEEIVDNEEKNTVRLLFDVNKKEKVKIHDITFEGNKAVKDRKLRRLLKGTKRKRAIFRKSKLVKEDLKEDKENVIAHYNKLGYRDAQILSDTIWRNADGMLNIHFNIDEGNQYKIRNISWKGNSIYADEQLGNVLGITKGDIFNREQLDKRLSFSQDGSDVSSLYLDRGYLFFNVEPTEIAVDNDSIDLEMRINEGPQATIDKIIIQGNDRTNEHVIRREVRTRPGQKFSRSDIIRSQRQIMNLGYFSENLQMNTPVNQQKGTVDVEYIVEERPSDQLELSAGYGGASGLIGTLGVTFNNFSVRNINKKETWNPLPQGDGQKLSLRIQSNSRFFRSYNFSFTEPWLGGKKPNSFTIGAVHSAIDQSSFNGGKLQITRGFIGLGTQLKKPDDFFISNTILNLERIKLDNYGRQFIVSNGNFKNFNINQTITRSSINEPIYPRRGSKISLSLQLTPPYSLFRKDNYWLLNDQEKADIRFNETIERGILTSENDLESAIAIAIEEEETARKFSYLEYHKWRFDAEFYFNFTDKLVMMTSAKMGWLGSYNSNIGIVPFERYEYGGDGLSNQNVGITGLDIISARGYETTDFSEGNNGGGTVFNKFTMELRYPLSTNPSSTIYTFGFLQAGNVWQGFEEYNPFALQRSAGLGLRVFLPMFGLLGFDYGWGMDKDIETTNQGYGKFSIILGFEPD